MRKPVCLVALIIAWNAPVLAQPLDLAMSQGTAAVEQQRWTDAMDIFLNVLRDDPKNAQAHAYITLVVREMELRRRAAIRQARVNLLDAGAKALEDSLQDSTLLTRAIADTTQADARAQDDRWHARCEEARVQRLNGHLLIANDVVLRVLAENPSYAEAQRELSDLQSALKHALDQAGALTMEERYAYQGFYAYGQSDYATAAAAWDKARAVIQGTETSAQAVEQRIDALRFRAHERIARAHVDEERRATRLREIFEQGMAQYARGRYIESLETFRRLAVENPDYPQLGFYLVQAENAAEKERERHLGAHKRAEVAAFVKRGVLALEQERFRDAENDFDRALAVDPSYSEARSYLALARAEMARRNDPKAAQLHYEAGLIDYASGKLEDAVREWRMATRLNPNHDKALVALSKVQKELALNQSRPVGP